MSIRNKRLENDYRALQKLCVFHEPEKIRLLETQGTPPDFYRLEISNCKGIQAVSDYVVEYRTEHILTISDFPSNYPDPGCLPTLKMETPIFHPHIYYNGSIDLYQDCRQFTQRLDTLVIIVISMIQYKNLKFGLPANSQARDWTSRNKHLFPLSSSSDGSNPFESQIIWK
jgi:ubiquitin-protein ligase